jgi:hypothetical protein
LMKLDGFGLSPTAVVPKVSFDSMLSSAWTRIDDDYFLHTSLSILFQSGG